ncbi:ATP-binding cassette-type vacuolar membrane transporter Hmt1 [Coemansia sp. RSA 1804]|nr:ATP-binding cassette-type vacuolar membrane transporter Hmt1 [Coemansia sp. RSA 1804]
MYMYGEQQNQEQHHLLRNEERDADSSSSSSSSNQHTRASPSPQYGAAYSGGNHTRTSDTYLDAKKAKLVSRANVVKLVCSGMTQALIAQGFVHTMLAFALRQETMRRGDGRAAVSLASWMAYSQVCVAAAWGLQYWRRYTVWASKKRETAVAGDWQRRIFRWSMGREWFWAFSLTASAYELHAYIVWKPQWGEHNGVRLATDSTMLRVLILMRIAANMVLVGCAIHGSALQRTYDAVGAEYSKLAEHGRQANAEMGAGETTAHTVVAAGGNDGDGDGDDALKSGAKKARMYHQSDELRHDMMGLRRRLRILAPFLWPSGERVLQLRMLGCVGILAAGRVVNVLAPLQFKIVVDGLAPRDGSAARVQWGHVLVYGLLRTLQGSVGVLSTVQSFVWIPVGQSTTKRISVAMFEHLHRLSLRFHVGRKTGEILRVQDRGVTSVVSLLTSLVFNVLPTLADIGLACYFFSAMFDLYFGTIVATTMGAYLAATVMLTGWRAKYRRKSNYLDNEMEARAVDSLLNFETVKYYNAEEFERGEYAHAVDQFQTAEWLSNATMNLMNLGQNLIVQAGMLAGALLSAQRVHQGEMTVGDFTMLLAYITQLYEPLSWFGTYYRVIQKNLIDMEKLLELFDEPIEVNDPLVPAPLELSRGEVVFDNVAFSYEGQPTLRNVSFRVPAGSTVAIVGPSGSGKSTILRLLLRFYDVQAGRILVDGQDIRRVSQADLRRAIGVVPQDTVLFNDSIRYNIAYGRAGSGHSVSMADVAGAADAAHIHTRIMGFADQYETRVGERGQRLSGGEKQRVAIARTLLKDPRIVCLDEATSALDSHTERQIQASLREMTHNRTTLIIAHRLSTIVHADQILIVQNGEIVERGTHAELVADCCSVYYDMWMKQLADAASASYDPILASVGLPFCVPGADTRGGDDSRECGYCSECGRSPLAPSTAASGMPHASVCQFEHAPAPAASAAIVASASASASAGGVEQPPHQQRLRARSGCGLRLVFTDAPVPRAANPQGWVPCGPFTAPLPAASQTHDAFNLEVVSPATSSSSLSLSLSLEETDSHNEPPLAPVDGCSTVVAEASTISNALFSRLERSAPSIVSDL